MYLLPYLDQRGPHLRRIATASKGDLVSCRRPVLSEFSGLFGDGQMRSVVRGLGVLGAWFRVLHEATIDVGLVWLVGAYSSFILHKLVHARLRPLHLLSGSVLYLYL